MYQMADAMPGKAKKAINCLLHSLHQFPCLSYSTFYKLFDSKIAPIMLYGSELWGLKNVACTELVHIYACKRFLNVHTMSCNGTIQGDLGMLCIYLQPNVV